MLRETPRNDGADGLELVAIRALVGAENPLPSRDFEDIQWDAAYLDETMLEIPFRPCAVRTDDLFQMPDSIFEAVLGIYYMAVRVINRWGLTFTEYNVLDITAPSGAELFRDTCSAKRVIADTGEDICSVARRGIR